VYLNLIDHDVKAGNGGAIWDESGVSSGNAAVSTSILLSPSPPHFRCITPSKVELIDGLLLI